jgi:hypothetical protein
VRGRRRHKLLVFFPIMGLGRTSAGVGMW